MRNHCYFMPGVFVSGNLLLTLHKQRSVNTADPHHKRPIPRKIYQYNPQATQIPALKMGTI